MFRNADVAVLDSFDAYAQGMASLFQSTLESFYYSKIFLIERVRIRRLSARSDVLVAAAPGHVRRIMIR